MNKKGVISRIYPLTKLVVVLIIVLTAIIWGDYRFGYFIVVPLLIFLAFLEGKFVSYTKKMIGAMIIMCTFIFIIKGLFDPSDQILWNFAFISVKKAGIESALRLTSIIFALGGSILLFFETTDLEDLMIALQKMGMSHVSTFIFLSTLQMIPQFAQKSKVIMQAQRARGIETEGNILIRIKAFFPTLTPLIISSISDIEDKVVTMEARAFSVEVKKTYMQILDIKLLDYIIMFSSLILFVIFLVWRYLV